MRRVALRCLPLFACALMGTAATTEIASAQNWEVRREIREGAREVRREKREAYRALKRCTTEECIRREVREGRREVARERRESRREVRREVREAYRDQWYRGGDRWYRDGRYWGRDEYERYYYHRRDGANDVLKGVLVGAAVVGVAAAIADDNDDD